MTRYVKAADGCITVFLAPGPFIDASAWRTGKLTGSGRRIAGNIRVQRKATPTGNPTARVSGPGGLWGRVGTALIGHDYRLVSVIPALLANPPTRLGYWHDE
jgi:hypothetical protein